MRKCIYYLGWTLAVSLTLSAYSYEKKDTSVSETLSFRLVHYNIKELSTRKLLDKETQTRAAVAVLKALQPDLLSINEIQFDKPHIPTRGLPGGGKNLFRLLALFLEQPKEWNVTFSQANTGNKARRLESGDYLNKHGSKTMEVADHENFGIFPGQYSTGFATRFPIQKRTINHSIKWKEWHPDVDFSPYRLGNQAPVPEDIALFDKNFSDTVITIDNRPLHVITFHTVPAYHFGNIKSPNAYRNAAQLEFLRWYLLGECEPRSKSLVRRCKTNLKPLPKTAEFIAVGDLNTDIHSADPGAEVLKKIFSHSRVQKIFPTLDDPAFEKDGQPSKVTYLADGADIEKLKLQLDYIIASKGLLVSKSFVYAPQSLFEEHGCFIQPSKSRELLDAVSKKLPKEKKAALSVRKEGQKTFHCVISASSKFIKFRKGSDHFPLVVDFKWNN